MSLMRLLACLIAAVVYVWQEQMEFLFSQVQFATVIQFAGSELIINMLPNLAP